MPDEKGYMTREEALAMLRAGKVEEWNTYREENPEWVPDLSKAVLEDAALDGVNLSSAKLSSVNLLAAKLREADLRTTLLVGAQAGGASLQGALLAGAHLEFSDLSDARLSHADLRRAGLREANLCSADLTNSDLRHADLTGTNLADCEMVQADLGMARMGFTKLTGLDLAQPIGLHVVNHAGPSSIDTYSLRLSRGLIPDEFLNGCGLEDWEVEMSRLYAPGLSAAKIVDIQQRIFDLRAKKLIQFHSAFISYSHADKAFAIRLHDALQREGIRCWRDEHQMLPGDDIYEQVDRGIRLWDKTLLCASEASLTSWWVDNEIDSCFEKERRLMGDRGEKVLALIPLDIDGYMFSGNWRSGKERQVKSRLAADFKGWEEDDAKFQAGLEKVLKALRSGDGGREPPPKPRL